MIHIETEEYTLDGPVQTLPGFENKYRNIVDYILKDHRRDLGKKGYLGDQQYLYKRYCIHSGARKITGIDSLLMEPSTPFLLFPIER
jgi:hypothetical protein